MSKPIARVLTVSDGVAGGARVDSSGEVARSSLAELGFRVDETAVVPDDKTAIAAIVGDWVDDPTCRMIVTTGGTGLGPRDVTPEAVRPLLEREIPGYGELLRQDGLRHTPTAVLSRSLAGATKAVLVVVLPGSPKAVSQGLSALGPTIPHALKLLAGDTEH